MLQTVLQAIARDSLFTESILADSVSGAQSPPRLQLRSRCAKRLFWYHVHSALMSDGI